MFGTSVEDSLREWLDSEIQDLLSNLYFSLSKIMPYELYMVRMTKKKKMKNCC